MDNDEPVAVVRINLTGGNAGISWQGKPLDGAPTMLGGELLYLRREPFPFELNGYRVFRDGNAWCATRGFVYLQESLGGFGDSPVAALQALVDEEIAMDKLDRQVIRNWRCNNCQTEFSMKWEGNHAPCPKCKVGAQYTQLLRNR